MHDPRCLADKLRDPEFLLSITERRKKQILLCSKMLTEEELRTCSSIDVGYQLARRRYIETILPSKDSDLARVASEEAKIPIFGIFGELE